MRIPNFRDPVKMALWAALPMAHTSKVEGRLQMILDNTQSRRTLTRRVIGAALCVSIVSVVSLAMLRPAVQAASEAASVQLMGVKDVNVHHTGHLWWKPDGQLLPPAAADAGAFQIDKDLFSSTDVKNLSFDLRLPANIDSETVKLIPAGSLAFAQQKVQSNENSRSRWTLTSSFPLTLQTTTLSVGVGAGPWTEVVNCPKKAGRVRLKRPSGEIIFTLIANPHGLTSAQEIYETCNLTSVQAAPGDVVLIVSDHFHNPSPLKVDKMAVMISSYASRTRSGEAVQKIRHDAENCERVVYGLDKSGRVITKLTGTMTLNLENEQNDRFKMDQLIFIPQSLLKRIAAFRLVTRPYQWTEFKNVALQPVQ